jgi:hypothetical protein
VVREQQEERRLYLPRYGIVELRARANLDPNTRCASWLIGFEDVPERSAEVCLMEVFGRYIDGNGTRVGLGVHPFGDPTLRDDFAVVELPIDAAQPHTYSVEWLPGRLRFSIDDALVRSVAQAPAYPLQLMLNIYELPDETGAIPASGLEAFRRYLRSIGSAAGGGDGSAYSGSSTSSSGFGSLASAWAMAC